MKRPTLKDIAALAGVSHVAVSMALRDHPRIGAATRQRIKEIAEQIGYRPDPALAALTVYRRESQESKYHATLAWVNFHHIPLKEDGFNYALFKGAETRCKELGYAIEEFRMVDLGMSFKRLSDVLYSRNIQGVLFGTQARGLGHISMKSFAWDRFSVISFGFSLVSPKLDVVIDAQYRAGRLIVRKLKSLGYRRIGFVAEEEFNERTDCNFLAGYLAEQIRLPAVNRVPPLLLGEDVGDPKERYKKECREWFFQHQPDGVFDTNGHLYRSLTPEELAHCGIAMHFCDEGIAGVKRDDHLIGRAGVNEVVNMINTNVRGIPEIPRRILIEGKWINGKSAPRIAFR